MSRRPNQVDESGSTGSGRSSIAVAGQRGDSTASVQLESLARDFDFLADSDPMYAVLHEKGKRRRQWDANEFFATGTDEVNDLLSRARKYHAPKGSGNALDFGSGLGRLSLALADHFENVVGVDVSPRMVELAKRIHEGNPRIRFVLNSQPDLSGLPDSSFDLVYTNKVLQHQPSVELVLGYVREFTRLVRPGGLLAFQVPERTSLIYKIFNRRRQFLALQHVGMNPRRLLDQFGMHPVRMIYAREADVASAIESAGGRVLGIERYLPEGPTYFATKADEGRANE